MPTDDVYLVRHAMIADAWLDHCYGALDIPLSDAGVLATNDRAAQWPDALAPTLILHSGLSRTAALADALSRRFPSVPLQDDSRLAERHYGSWQGLTWDEVYGIDPNFHAVLTDPAGYAPFRTADGDGETTTQMQDRTMAWYRELPPGRIVAVSHGGPIAALAGTLLDLPPTEWTPWHVPPLGGIRITRPGNVVSLLSDGSDSLLLD